MSELFFYLFSAILLGSAAMVVTSRNPVHAVLYLILAFFNAAALFVLAGAEFLAMILVIVYVGAVAVLFLFVVMMLDVNFAQLREGFQKYLPVGATVGAVLFLELLLMIWGWRFAGQATALRGAPQVSGVQNTVALGRLIYTDYILLFQMSGLVLLVAMIGAIVLTHRRPQNTRRQVIAVQVGRTVSETLEMMTVELGAGTNATGIIRPKVAEPETVDDHAGGGHGAGGH